MPETMQRSVTLVRRLAVNDFKTKYAASYLGIIWAFIQPLVTVLVYWFVFSKVRGGGAREVPYILWLIAGLVPWFFFQDGMNAGTGALIEYHYLVKKVVFPIEVLPQVKLVSASFVHLFFIGVMLVLYLLMGYFPGISVVQVLYYSGALYLLLTGMTWLTSAVVVFFRDLSQIISILLQVGVWMTPIMWNFDDLNIQGTLALIFRLNPMYYIVEGYRDALITGRWFWMRPQETLYFWCFVLAANLIGRRVFRKLKIHFADIL